MQMFILRRLENEGFDEQSFCLDGCRWNFVSSRRDLSVLEGKEDSQEQKKLCRLNMGRSLTSGFYFTDFQLKSYGVSENRGTINSRKPRSAGFLFRRTKESGACFPFRA